VRLAITAGSFRNSCMVNLSKCYALPTDVLDAHAEFQLGTF
jgi:hypothetical protein